MEFCKGISGQTAEEIAGIHRSFPGFRSGQRHYGAVAERGRWSSFLLTTVSVVFAPNSGATSKLPASKPSSMLVCGSAQARVRWLARSIREKNQGHSGEYGRTKISREDDQERCKQLLHEVELDGGERSQADPRIHFLSFLSRR